MASLSAFVRCSKVDATISGSVGEKYFIRFFVTVEMSPFSFNFFKMSDAVTRLIRALVAMFETTLWPSSIIDKYTRASLSVSPIAVRIGRSSFGILLCVRGVVWSSRFLL